MKKMFAIVLFCLGFIFSCSEGKENKTCCYCNGYITWQRYNNMQVILQYENIDGKPIHTQCKKIYDLEQRINRLERK